VIVATWVREVLDQLGSISLPLLLLALTLHTCETLLNALAWRNILRRAYPDSGPRSGSSWGRMVAASA
jgi:uncharacterized membrane protein YbhN (UPF0104 family)